MKWMMGVVLAVGLSGCSWLDDTRVSGAGAVIEQQHGVGRQVTRVLAGCLPASIWWPASRADCASAGRRTCCPTWC